MSIRAIRLEQVLKSLKWKQSDKKSASRLGMTVNYYKDLKKEIKESGHISTSQQQEVVKERIDDYKKTGIIEKKASLDKGTEEYKALSLTEPQTSEEIEELLKLDLDKWKLSSYWNKQQSNGTWLISAQVSQIKKSVHESISAVFDTLKFSYEPVNAECIINTSHEEQTCAILSLQDIHIGKENLDGSGPEDVILSVKSCIENLIYRTYHSSNLDKIVFVLGGDLLNMDTYLGTTTSGTPVDNSTEAYKAYKLAFDLMYWAVNFLKQFCTTLEVVYIPGNHSRLTEAHIAYALSKAFTNPDIIWNIDYAERKVITYGSTMLCLEHGDYDTKKSFYVFATEFAKDWGSTEHRVLYTGHYHKEKTIQYITRDETNGFTIKILPSLSKTDKYHYSNKWTNNKRGGIIETYTRTKGCTGSFSYFE